MSNNLYNSDYLAHYGVKGMKWGKRKAAQNSGYSSKQRKEDRSLYGAGGERRINRSMNRGHNVKSARSKEVLRRDKTIARARRAGMAAGLVGTGASMYLGYKLSMNPESISRAGYKATLKYGNMAIKNIPSKYKQKAVRTMINPKFAKGVGYASIGLAGVGASVAPKVGRKFGKRVVIDGAGYRNASTTQKYRG